MSETQIVTTPILGIHRTSDLTTRGGECIEIVNMRPEEDGVWRPIPKPESKFIHEDHAWLRDINIIVRHRAAGEEAYIVATQIRLLFISNQTITQSIYMRGITSITPFQNAVIVTLKHDHTTNNNNVSINFLYDKDRPLSSRYKQLPEIKLPLFNVERETTEFGTGDNHGETIEAALGKYHERIAELAEDKYFTGHALLFIAYRMKDDSKYIYSQPIYVPLSYTSSLDQDKILFRGQAGSAYGGVFGFSFGSDRVDMLPDTEWKDSNSLTASKASLSYLITQELKDATEEYEGILDSVEVYAHHLSSHYNLTSDLEDYEFTQYGHFPLPLLYFKPKAKLVPTETLEQFFDTPSVRRILSIPITEITEATIGVHSKELDLSKTLSGRPVSLNNFSNHAVSGDNTKIINNRLHLSRVTTVMGKGADPTMKITQTNYHLLFPGFDQTSHEHTTMLSHNYSSNISILYQYHIKTDQGTRIINHINPKPTVFFYQEDIPFGPKDYLISSSFLLAYPDKRAFKAEVFLISNSTPNSAFKLSSHTLTPHPFHNIAYTKEGMPENPLIPLLAKDIIRHPLPTGTGKIRPITPENNALYEHNRLQVSSADNPLIFPAALSYRFDDNTVRTVAAIAETISEGQYGQFPLIIFTSENIYALRQNDPSVLYDQKTVLRREYVQSDTVLPIPGGIAYMASGMMKILWKNQKVREASQILQKITNQFLITAVTNTALDRDMTPNVSPEDMISTDRFDKYIESKKTALIFNDYKNEIIVSNPDYKYAYVYNLNAETWYKNTYPAYSSPFLNNGEGFLGREILLYQYGEGGGVAVLLGVGGAGMGSSSYTKIVRSIIRANLLPADKGIGFYILGSNDGVTWKLAGGAERTGIASNMGAHISDIEIKRLSQSFKQISFLLTGTLEEGSEISRIESEAVTRYATRLR